MCVSVVYYCIMIYGSEAWRLDDEVKRALDGANSKMVSTITGRTIREEVTADETHDVVTDIRTSQSGSGD